MSGPGTSAVAAGGPCTVTCLPGDLREEEAPCGDGFNQLNGDATLCPDLSKGDPLDVLQPLALDSSVCGTSGTYLDQVCGIAGDVDWYWFTLDLPREVTWCVTAEFAPTLSLRSFGPDAIVRSVKPVDDPCTPACITACLGPGTYFVSVSVDPCSGVPCPATYRGTLTAGPPCAPPGTNGACCVDDGCQVTNPGFCEIFGGVFFGGGSSCATVDCATGACCLPSGCAELSADDCAAAGGTYHGGVSCAETACPGACCLGDGGCIQTTETACLNDFFGVFLGAGTTCADACVAMDLGACCAPQGCVAPVDAAYCAAVGGTFLGAGAACPPCGCIPVLSCGEALVLPLASDDDCMTLEQRRAELCEGINVTPCNVGRVRFRANGPLAMLTTLGSGDGDTAVWVRPMIETSPGCFVVNPTPIATDDDQLCAGNGRHATMLFACLDPGLWYEVEVIARDAPTDGVVLELTCLESFQDCNLNCVDDLTEIQNGDADDCNENGIPDACEPDCGSGPPGCGGFVDCNGNCIPDDEELVDNDCDGNGIPDDCDFDCDFNGLNDACEIAEDPSLDANGNGRIDDCECGCTDLVFVIDDTGSMNGAITQVRSELGTIVEAALAGAANDLRVGVITYKDSVRVRLPLTDDLDAVAMVINTLQASGGANLPEASDEALRMAIDMFAGCESGSLEFDVPYREFCTHIAILITDALPGGCDDDFDLGVDDVNAAERAADAFAAGLRISAIYVPTFGFSANIDAIMDHYAATTGGISATVEANGSGTADAVVDILFQCFECAADFNGSGTVDFTDLVIMLGTWGACGDGGCIGDLDFDGAVGFEDLVVLLSTWGACGE